MITDVVSFCFSLKNLKSDYNLLHLQSLILYLLCLTLS